MSRSKAKEEFGRASSRRQIIDKERAITGATNPVESKYGGCLLKGNTQESRLLNTELSKLDNQLRRQRMHIDQEKKQFLMRHSLPDPMLIVERPPSPENLRKLMYSSDPDYFDESREPNYMRPTQCRVRTPSNISTIDAFTVKERKKKNIWEEAYLSHQKPRFQSSVMPSLPLSEEDQLELARGWDLHVKPPRSADALARSLDHSARGVNKKSRKNKKRKAAKESIVRFEETASTFITEVPKMRYSTENLGMERPSKSVSFADEVGLYFSAKDEIENRRKAKTLLKAKSNKVKDNFVEIDSISTEGTVESLEEKVLAETTNTNTNSGTGSRVTSRENVRTRERPSGKKKPISPFRHSTKNSKKSTENEQPVKINTAKHSPRVLDNKLSATGSGGNRKGQASTSLKSMNDP